MANELSVNNEGGQGQGLTIAETIEKNGLTEMIKPLVKEIHLFDTFVAGTSYVDKEVLKAAKVGDGLALRREQDNRFDNKAILVLNSENKKLGYIPEKDNVVFSRLMDAGKLLTGKIKRINWKGDFSKIEISIYLQDF